MSGAGAPPEGMVGKFTLISGPMCAGKTTELRRLAENHARCDLRVLLIRHVSDRRGEETSDSDGKGDGRSAPTLFTHRGDWGINPALSPLFRTESVAVLSGVVPTDRETLIAIDEGQFFPDLAACARKWADEGRTVVASALNGKADRTPWPSVSAAYAEIDDHIFVSAVCGVCRRPDRQAVFTLRREGAPKPDAGGVAIGGAESYVPACRSCAAAAAEP